MRTILSVISAFILAAGVQPALAQATPSDRRILPLTGSGLPTASG